MRQFSQSLFNKFYIFLSVALYLLLLGSMIKYSKRYLAEAVEKSLNEYGAEVERRLKERLHVEEQGF